ncbi:MAG: transglycosylase SLT domain-containing protein [Bacteroidia bacterium]|nr:transglycosylase SLT domain-containing protein [Bacteroidia bacterium]
MILIDNLKTNKGENSSEFEAKVSNICNLLSINPDWLMMVMYMESSLNAQAVNKQPGDPDDDLTRCNNRATGLLQFMPDTAKGMGTSNSDLYGMSAVEQLDYVYQYFKSYTGKIKSFQDLYLVTFFPAAIGKPDDFIFQTSRIPAQAVAKQNSAIDFNQDGKISVAEFKQYLLKRVPAALLQFIVEKKSTS